MADAVVWPWDWSWQAWCIGGPWLAAILMPAFVPWASDLYEDWLDRG